MQTCMVYNNFGLAICIHQGAEVEGGGCFQRLDEGVKVIAVRGGGF